MLVIEKKRRDSKEDNRVDIVARNWKRGYKQNEGLRSRQRNGDEYGVVEGKNKRS